MKIGIPSVGGGWALFLYIVFNNDAIKLPEEIEWAKQIIPIIPLIAGHHVLAWRIHG